jgi:hypothetical protein
VHTRRSLALLLAAAALAAGCGGDDGGEEENGGGTPRPAAAAKVADDAKIDGAEGRRIADVTLELLNAPNGDDPCYEITASDYVESLGGLEGCAKKLGPIATGPLDTVTAAGPSADGRTGTAEVESSDGGQKQTIEFAKAVNDKWNVDGLGE